MVKILVWFNPTNLDLPYPTEYASQFSIELLYSENCLREKKDYSCLSVQVLFNGKALEFADSCADPSLCSYLEFKSLIDSIWYKGEDAGDWTHACQL